MIVDLSVQFHLLASVRLSRRSTSRSTSWYPPWFGGVPPAARCSRSVLSNSPAARRSMTKSLVIERRAKGNRHCSAFFWAKIRTVSVASDSNSRPNRSPSLERAEGSMTSSEGVRAGPAR